MKKVNYLLLFAAIFLGVFSALQLNGKLERRQDSVRWNTSDGLVRQADFDSSDGPSDFRYAAQKVLPSVVSVDKYQEYESMDLETYLQETATGSGVIVSSNGTIVTNNHVVAGASVVRVRLYDKRSFQAKVIGTDARADIAVLKINASGLTPITIGDSSKVAVGQWVVAVGNPLGYDGTVSVGVVSSLGRSLVAGGEDGGQQSMLIDAIQTDAAINAGNSGGALTDVQGRLIGINSAIASTSGGSIGIGFAIPIDHVRTVVDDILRYGYVKYGGLGVVTVPNSSAYLTSDRFRAAMQHDVGAFPPAEGILVRSVEVGSVAERAGISQFDVLLEINGAKLSDEFSLNKALLTKRPGDQVRVKFWHRGTVKEVTVALQELRG